MLRSMNMKNSTATTKIHMYCVHILQSSPATAQYHNNYVYKKQNTHLQTTNPQGDITNPQIPQHNTTSITFRPRISTTTSLRTPMASPTELPMPLPDLTYALRDGVNHRSPIATISQGMGRYIIGIHVASHSTHLLGFQ